MAAAKVFIEKNRPYLQRDYIRSLWDVRRECVRLSISRKRCNVDCSVVGASFPECVLSGRQEDYVKARDAHKFF